MTNSKSPDYSLRLKDLRAEIARRGLDGFIVPMTDEYQSEYVPEYARRIAFLTGFTGSAGTMVVLPDQAVFFTDGRYTLQAEQQLTPKLYTILDITAKRLTEWLVENLKAGQKIGYDPWLLTADIVERLNKAVTKTGAEFIAMADNPVDAIWKDRPAPHIHPVELYDVRYAGKESPVKRAELAEQMRKDGLDAALLADPASIAWLLNIRGGDIAHTPLALSYAVLHADGKLDWFIDPQKVSADLYHISGVKIHNPDDFADHLDALGKAAKKIRVDLCETASWIVERLRAAGAHIDSGSDLCALPRACKNSVELAGMRAAHERDGVALARFFHWLSDKAETGKITELDAEKQLLDFRAQDNLFRGPSFETIAGYGPHGAIVHYRATEATNSKLEPGGLFLLDSGGQYLDGTTDVTRTIAIGKPTDEMRDRFTRVLKGHIALATARFPAGTVGGDLDVLARQYLWEAGVDYNHGTGHGVGCYLGVHEGPQNISRRSRDASALKPGMVISNEPGYYKAGAYGIRIENLVAVLPAAHVDGGEQPMHAFETLTLAPIDTRLVMKEMLAPREIAWLNDYHARVVKVIGPRLDKDAAAWLKKVTQPV